MSESGASRRILLVDADAFFVAVARQVDPEGAGRAPLLIVGGRPGSRGVVCSASYECRAFGVRSAMPIARALRLCPEALCVPVPRDACLERSRAIERILMRFAPVVQPSSIDEWYCDLGGTEALYGGEMLDRTAARMRQAVFDATGLHVSIGGGTSKLVAKVAVERAKPKPGSGATGVCCVPPGSESAFLADFRLADLPMVGPRFVARLERMGLTTVGDAQQWSEAALVHRLGERAGRWLAQRVQGVDTSPVTAGGRRKQVSREDTFGRNLVDEAVIERELLRLAVRVGTDLRRQGWRARTVTVKLRTSDFQTRTMQRTLTRPVESERVVARVARHLYRTLRRSQGVPVRLLGIALSHFEEDVVPPAEAQLGLFHEPAGPRGAEEEGSETPRDRALSQALDRIRKRFGAAAILPARLVGASEDTGERVEE